MHPKHETNKVGIIPYIFRAKTPYFLIHLPVAKIAEEQHLMTWGIPRGTVRDIHGNDIRQIEQLRATHADHIEDHWQTALHEIEEECGILPEDMVLDSVKNHGLMDYGSQRLSPYPLQIFSVMLRHDDLDTLIDRASDATALAFASLNEIRANAESGSFKPGYLPIIQVIADTL